MTSGFKIAYRCLVLGALVATVLTYRAERQAEEAYLALNERCYVDYKALPAGEHPDAEWTERCAWEEPSSEINTAMRALDATVKPFLASVIVSAVLLLAMAAVYFLRRGRRA